MMAAAHGVRHHPPRVKSPRRGDDGAPRRAHIGYDAHREENHESARSDRVPDLATAQQVVGQHRPAQDRHEIELDDLVVVERQLDGKVKLHQPSLAGRGAAGGALWGGLIGLIFFMPLFGMAIGAASGAAAGALSDAGVDDKFMKELGEELTPGNAAVIALIRNMSLDKVLEDDPHPRPHHPLVARQRDGVAASGGTRGRRPRLTEQGVATGPVAAPRGDEAPRDDSDATRDDAAPAPLADAPERPPPQRVEIVIPVRTLLVVLPSRCSSSSPSSRSARCCRSSWPRCSRSGLDPPVGALVRRGWGRGRAALALFAALFASVVMLVLVTAGPVWDQIVEFVQSLRPTGTRSRSKPAFQSWISTAAPTIRSGRGCRSWRRGCRTPRTRCSAIAGGVFGSVLSLVTLTFLSLFLLMERPTITDWLFGFTPPATERRWRPVVEDSITAVSSSLIGNVAISIVAAHGRRPVGVGASGCRSRSCWP